MTVSEIYNEILSQTNKPLTLVTIRRRINEAIDYLSSMYEKMIVKIEVLISCTDLNTYYDIPSNAIGIYKVFDKDSNEYKNFDTLNQTIKFKNIGTYKLQVNIKPNLQSMKNGKEMLNEVVNVNSLFTRPIIFYIMSLIEENPNKSMDYRNMATNLAEEANSMAKKQDKSKNRRMPAPLWR